MKKNIIIFGLLLISVSLYAQSKMVKYIDECINLIGKSVPRDYIRGNRTIYYKTYEIDYITIVLVVNNGIVNISSLGASFDTTHEAAIWLSQFYDIFESKDWQYDNYNSNMTGLDVYKKGGIYICIDAGSRREDGMIVNTIYFVKNINDLLSL